MRWPNAKATARGSDLRSAMRHLHYLTGLLIFVLTWLRFILWTQAFVPPSEPAPPRGLQLVTLFIHIVLYAIPIAQPALGWLALSAKAAPVLLFGMAFGSGLSSGRAMASPHMRQLFKLQPGEGALCFINVGTVSKTKKPRVRPETTVFVSCL